MCENTPENNYKPQYDRPVDPYIDMPQSEVEELKKNRDLVIDDSNFHEYFFDVRTHDPKDGQVMACFRAHAEFVDGPLKRDVLNLLKRSEHGGQTANAIMRKLACATEACSFKVPLQMASDLAIGMSEEDVCAKPYEYDLECFYYTDPENVPKANPHWQIIRLIGRPKNGSFRITSNIREKLKELGLNNESEFDPSEEQYGREIRNRDVGQEVGQRPEEMGNGSPPAGPTSPEG